MWNLIKFTATLRFYVKSILANFESQKTAFLTVLEGQDFDFGKIQAYKIAKIPLNQSSEPLELLK